MESKKDTTSTQCLSILELKAFIANDINKKERMIYQAHINSCPFCRDAISGLSHFIETNNIEAKISSLKWKIRRRSQSNYFNRGKFLDHKNFHRWITNASIAAVLIIIIGTFYYIQYSWNKYATIASQDYEIKHRIEEFPQQENDIYIPAFNAIGEALFIAEFKAALKSNNISFKDQNLILVFNVLSSGEIINVKTPNIDNDSIEQVVKNILIQMGNWQPATINDEMIDSEIKIIIPAI